MGETNRVGTLDISDNLDFQRRSWSAQRLGWIVMAALIIAALAGLLGNGRISGATAGDASAFEVRYARIVRHYDSSQLRVDVPSNAAIENQIEIAIERSFLEGINLESIIPEPESVEAGSDEIIYAFDVSDPEQPVTITYNYEPIDVGPTSVNVGVNDERPVSLDIFVLP